MTPTGTSTGLDNAFAAITDHWAPKIVAQVNDMHVKVVKVQGEFVWHVHDDTDELFLVHSGSMTIHMVDLPSVTLNRGELYVVPKGVEHCPVAEKECEVVLLEPTGLVNTGDATPNRRTAPTGEWI